MLTFNVFRRIRKGIPNRIRGEMWKVVLDVAEMRLENRDLFQVSSSRPSCSSPDRSA